MSLIERFAADPDEAVNFCHTFFYSGRKFISGIHTFTSQVLIPFARDYRAHVERVRGVAVSRRPPRQSRRVFIVHGHDDAARETAARFLERLEFEPIILHEQASRGMTIAEKLEAHADVGFAVVLLTPDDVGRSVEETNLNGRARQNVILELGYFIGRLGRERVCALKRGEVEIPSDYLNVVYTPFDDTGGWKTQLAKELGAAGYEIDWNRIMR